MSVDLVQPPRLVVTTSAGPVEVAAAAVAAATGASDVFSADVREEQSLPRGIDLVVTAPLAHAPSLRLHVGWADRAADGAALLEVSVDVEPLDPAACTERDRRTRRAVDRFVEILGEQLAR